MYSIVHIVVNIFSRHCWPIYVICYGKIIIQICVNKINNYTFSKYIYQGNFGGFKAYYLINKINCLFLWKMFVVFMYFKTYAIPAGKSYDIIIIAS